MKRSAIPALAALLWGAGTLDCGHALDTPIESSPPAAGGARELKFLWIPKEKPESNPVFDFGAKGAAAKAGELTANGDIKVNVDIQAPTSAADIDTQVGLVLEAKALKLDGVAVSCSSADGLRSAIKEVIDAQIPVMTFDSDSPGSGRFTYLGGNNPTAGALAAHILTTAMGATPERKKIALVSGVRGADNLEQRIAGFSYAITSTRPDLLLLDGEIAYSDDNPSQAAAAVEDILRKHPDLGGLFLVGMWAIKGCNTADCSDRMPHWSRAAADGTLKTVAFDTLKFELDFVSNGLISGLVGQRCWGWGSDSIQMLYDHVVYGKNFDDSTDTGHDVVCPNNVAEMQAMWEFDRLTPQLSDCVIDGVTIR